MLRVENLNSVYDSLNQHSTVDYQVLESMADWVKVVNLDGVIVYANRALIEAMTVNPIGKKCHETRMSSGYCPFCVMETSLKTRRTVQKEEKINGRYYNVKSSPIFNEKNELIGVVEVFRDISEKKNLEIELIKKNEKLIKDINLAKILQGQMLPKKGDYHQLNFDYKYIPSEMLSGDIFDIFYVDKDHIGIYVADVVGHGVTASLITMFIRQTMRLIGGESLNPAMVLTDLQNKFSNINLGDDMYFTIFYGVFNTVNNKFRYANAGHNCIPIIFNDNEIKLMKISGLPISLVFENVFYKDHETVLEKGDSLLFYTDGITEVRNREGQELGVEGLIDIVRFSDNKNILDAIISNVDGFRWGEQKDDTAIVLMKVNG